MAKHTLLEMTQEILNDLDSDEVQSIDDTVESQQVAQIIRSCYEELVSNRNWPDQKKLIQLDAFNDLEKPNYLKIPDDVKELISFQYDCVKFGDSKLNYREIKYKYPDEFLTIVNKRNSSLDRVTIITDTSGSKLSIYNDIAPSFWTSFNDEDIVCDAYDSAVDDTLKKSKTQAFAVVEKAWTHVDNFIPDLPSDAFSLLQEEAKSTAFIVLKQLANQKAEQKAARQNRWLSRKAWKAKGGVRYEDYGRKGKK